MEIPKISYGQQLMRRFILSLTEARFVENYRSEWLFGMELDFYFPEFKIAIEFNGDQHYFETEKFGSPEEQKVRDWRKRDICRKRGIKVINILAIDLIYSKLRGKFKNKLPLKPKGRKSGKSLNQEAIEYRKILKSCFGSPTASRKGCQPYLAAVKKLEEAAEKRKSENK